MATAEAITPAADERNDPTSAAGRNAAMWQDLREGFAKRELWIFLGWRDVKKHYQRSVIGPFWLTLSMGILVGSLGFLYAELLGRDVAVYLPYLAVGFILWGFISESITKSCAVFSASAAAIRQIRMPLSVYGYQFVWAQLISLAHNFLIYVLVILIFGINPGWSVLLFLPAMAILSLNAFFCAMLLGPFCARFRDVPMILSSFIRVAFFLTPILWSVDQFPGRAYFVDFNPFYHFLEIARDPLLGGTGTLTNWLAAIGMTLVFGFFTMRFFSRFRSRITYWA